MPSPKYWVAAACALLFTSVGLATPYPYASMPEAIDLGLTQNKQAEISLTVALKLRNTDQLNATIANIYTPGRPSFHHFLTRQQFADQFGPSADTVSKVSQHFQAKGFTVTRSATSQLQIKGSVAAVQSEFAVQLHDYQVAQNGTVPAFKFRAPAAAPTVSAQIADLTEGVFGLDTRPRYVPHFKTTGAINKAYRIPGMRTVATSTPHDPGHWTVADFTQYYNVDPLYSQGITGAQQTIGILTLASFTPTDAYGYWKSLGLKVNVKRITEIPVDGGSGPPSDDSGSVETTLDVEQSGGIAPDAGVLVFEAPNNTQGFVDVFAAGIDQNKAATLSISWGEWEWFDTFVSQSGTTTSKVLNTLLTQAALQGQSVMTAAGDSGAYEANNPALYFPVPRFNKVVSIGDPGAQAYITNLGGTTLPGEQDYSLPDGSTYKVVIPTERIWGWDYLNGLCTALGFTPVSCGIFPAGGGGGVSSYQALPSYQVGVAGIAKTPSGQELDNPNNIPLPPGFTLPVKLPAGFAGRNTPDLSFNSDPETGYVVWYTSSETGFGIETFFGGTSFAAPQFNGVASLLAQGLKGRVGLINYPLYNILRAGSAYSGSGAPFRDIRVGDNWYWQGATGYDQGTGVGVPNVASLLNALQSGKF